MASQFSWWKQVKRIIGGTNASLSQNDTSVRIDKKSLTIKHLSTTISPLVLDRSLDFNDICLRVGVLEIRSFRREDALKWEKIREQDADILARREATIPGAIGQTESFWAWRKNHMRAAQLQEAITLAIVHQKELVGCMTVFPIIWGAVRQAWVGYWVASAYNNCGIGGLSLAMTLDYLLTYCQLNRVEVLVESNNLASIKLVKRIDLREEGVRKEALWVSGEYRDHNVYVGLQSQVHGWGHFVRKWFRSYRR